MDEIQRFEMRAEFDKQADDKSVHALDPDGLDEEGHYKLRFSNEYGLYLESSLQSAREEVERQKSTTIEPLKIQLKKWMDSYNTLKAESARMRKAVAEYRKEAETGIAEEKLSGNVVKEAQWRGIETSCLYFQAVLTPPAAPEKAERINDKQEKYLNDQDKSLNII